MSSPSFFCGERCHNAMRSVAIRDDIIVSSRMRSMQFTKPQVSIHLLREGDPLPREKRYVLTGRGNPPAYGIPFDKGGKRKGVGETPPLRWVK